MLFLFRGLLDFCCPKIPFYWETIFHLVFLDKEFFYLKWLLNKILCFKKEKKKLFSSLKGYFLCFSTAMFVPYFKNNFNKLLKGNTCVSNYSQQASLYPIISYLYHQASLCHPVNWFLLWLPSLWPLPCVCWPGCKFDWPVEQVL